MDESLSLLIPSDFKMGSIKIPLHVLGIDLGTTNSTVVEILWSPSDIAKLKPRCLEIEQETTSGLYTHFLVPSAVALHNGKEWVGEGAKRLHARAPDFGLELYKNLFLECKNDIGTRRTYHKAPQGYQSASEIGGRVLRFLKQAAEQEGNISPTKTVVTVPASFQSAQRLATVEAALLAGIPLSAGELLDEPVAAFLDYLLIHSEALKGLLSEDRNLLVFDFGGGTCDVAIFKIGKASAKKTLKISPLSVSRYHRLGGGDIDSAILYEILLPQLLDQNNLEVHALSYEDKKNFVEPALLGVSEALKIGLCNEISRLKRLGAYDSIDKDQLLKKHPGLLTFQVGDQTLKLQSPTLSVIQFEELLKPFLDQDLLYARETEYRLTCSAFSPIYDALERSGLESSEIDLCLLVGGSSLIPQVSNEIEAFFNKAELLTYDDYDSVLVSVARGAAYHAFSLAAFGRSIFQVSSSDRLSIRTAQGAYELIPSNTPLPYPPKGEWAQTYDLTIPETALKKSIPLRVEILAGSDSQERILFTAKWDVLGPVNKGDKLKLEYRLDENQLLSFRLTLADQPDKEPFKDFIENPLTNIVNPHKTRLRIQEMEEDLRTGKISKEEVPKKVVQIAQDYAELNQNEKAISYLRQALRIKNQPDAYILNLLGIYTGGQGDFVSQEKYYRESALAGGDDAALFNLALSQRQQRKYQDAEKTILERSRKFPDSPGFTLAAQIAEALGNNDDRDSYIEKALSDFGPLRSLDDWELGWLVTASRMGNDKDKQDAAEAERIRRKSKGRQTETVPEGILPEQAAGLLRKI